MNRYHIKLGFNHISQLRDLTEQLNLKNWGYSEHCLDNLKYRAIDLRAVLLFVKGIKLNFDQIFEYYSNDKNIVKLCYRISYDNLQDIILVVTPEKKIITIYINSANDLHDTLKKELYKNTLTK
jgi:hypothetical protein